MEDSLGESRYKAMSRRVGDKKPLQIRYWRNCLHRYIYGAACGGPLVVTTIFPQRSDDEID